MGWFYNEQGLLSCPVCGGQGCRPCPIDHTTQAPNYQDDDSGPYYFCEFPDGCVIDGTDWDADNPFYGCESAEAGSTVRCPHCEFGGREDTYIGG